MKLTVDTDSRAILLGYTQSLDFPTTEQAFSRIYRGASDVFLMAMMLPHLYLKTPSGGERYHVGETVMIEWIGWGIDSVLVQHFSDGGIFWHRIGVASTVDEGYMAWIPQVSSESNLIRIQDIRYPSYCDQSESVFEVEGMQAASILLKVPQGGEVWSIDSTAVLQWEQEGVKAVDLELSRDGGLTWSELAAADTTESGRFSWVVTAPPSDQCFIRVSSHQDSGLYDQNGTPFTIQYSPAITLTQPNGDERWPQQTDQEIRWTAVNVDTVILSYSLDDGWIWTLIDTVEASVGHHLWHVPDVISDSAMIRVADVLDPDRYDESDRSFQIIDLTQISPEGTDGIPESVHLWQNYPNPFNNTTHVSYKLPFSGTTQFLLFNAAGKCVKHWPVWREQKGMHEQRLEMDALPTGVYLLTMIIENDIGHKAVQSSIKIMILR